MSRPDAGPHASADGSPGAEPRASADDPPGAGPRTSPHASPGAGLHTSPDASRDSGPRVRPRTSVVVPAFDEERLLGACLRSLARQTRPALEVVVVDNNSRDRTAQVARAHGARVVTEPVQGIWPAAATGYDAAVGELVARCDADSVLPADWIERIEDAFDADPDLRALTGPGVFAGLPPVRRLLADLLYMRAYFGLVGLALGHPPLFGSNLAMRASVWRDVRREVHAASDAVHDDIDLSFHVGRGRQVRLDPDLRVDISARPLRDVRGLADRVVKGFRSVRIHSPGDGPWARYREKVLARTGRG